MFRLHRAGDPQAQELALELGASWAGASEDPAKAVPGGDHLAPVGALVPVALRALAPGGTVARGHPHERHPELPYELLWEERSVRSVANLTRSDGHELLQLARQAGVRTHVTTYPLERTGDALEDLRAGAFTGAAVVVL